MRLIDLLKVIPNKSSIYVINVKCEHIATYYGRRFKDTIPLGDLFSRVVSIDTTLDGSFYVKII